MVWRIAALYRALLPQTATSIRSIRHFLHPRIVVFSNRSKRERQNLRSNAFTVNRSEPIRVLAWATLLMAAWLVGSCSPERPAVPASTPTRQPGETAESPGATASPFSSPQPAPTRRATATLGSQLGVETRDLQGTTLTFWHVWSWEAGEALQDLVDQFNRDNPDGIQVEAENLESYGDLSRQLTEALAAGDPPQVVVGFNNQIRGWDRSFGAVVDLGPYVSDPERGFSTDDMKDFYPLFWEQEQYGDARLGLPAQRSAQVLFYNTTWAQELGFSAPPATLAEFEEQACTAAAAYFNDEDETNDGLGGWVIDTTTAPVLTWIYAFGGEVETPSGYEFVTPETENAFAFLKGLFDSGCGWLAQSRFPNDEFATRKALFISSSTTGLPFQEEAFSENGSSDRWQVIAYPSATGTPIIDVFGPSFAILESSPSEQLAAWLFVRWLLEPENQAAWIETTGHLPSRAAALDHLAGYAGRHAQWNQAVQLLPWGLPEPKHASWGSVRWVLSDAAEQMFRIGLTPEQLPALLLELERTAAELHAQSR